MKKFFTFLLISILCCNCSIAYTTQASATTDYTIISDNELLSILNTLKKIHSQAYIHGEAAFNNKLNKEDSTELKSIIVNQINTLESLRQDLFKTVTYEDLPKVNSQNALKVLIVVSSYKLSYEELLSYINNDNSTDNFKDFEKFTYNLLTGLENLNIIEQKIKGSL